MPTMPPIPSTLLVKPTRPAAPISGSPEALLTHAANFGAYVQQLEAQLNSWIKWAQERANEPAK
ncbi:hypothetical protein [Kingella negevensis]|uniref:hypothetical protein n=1 Tax=Kingella negevensis TaxID=1522312 RepID=UPI003D6CE784